MKIGEKCLESKKRKEKETKREKGLKREKKRNIKEKKVRNVINLLYYTSFRKATVRKGHTIVMTL